MNLILCGLAVLAFVNTAMAITANPNSFRLTQPDGFEFEVKMYGDADFHYLTDLSGRTIVHSIDGYYYFAELDSDDNLAPSNRRVGSTHAVELEMESDTILPPMHKRSKRESPKLHRILANQKAIKSHNTVVMPNLVIPVRFNDHTNKVLPDKDDIDILMNHQGYHPLAPTGSVRDVFNISSYGALDLSSTTVDWVLVSQSESYYANGNFGLSTRLHQGLIESLNYLDAQGFNFQNFDTDNDGWIDAITFLHSGYGAEWGGTGYHNRIWSHKWALSSWWTSSSGVKVSEYHISPATWGTSGNTIGRIGVIAHETGHFLGLPDLYDYGQGSGIGSWCLMANSWGFDYSQYRPPIMSPWSKMETGWSNPTVIEHPGKYAISRVYDNNQIYRINHGYRDGEYLLIENRQPVGFEADVPGGGGLIIYHIDNHANFNLNNGFDHSNVTKHYRVAVLPADGDYHLEHNSNRGDSGDLWRSSVDGIGPSTGQHQGPYPNTDRYSGIFEYTGISIYDISASSDSMSFSVSFDLPGDDDNNTAPIVLPYFEVGGTNFGKDENMSADASLFMCGGTTIWATIDCGGNNTILRLLDGAGNQMDWNDESAYPGCAEIVYSTPASSECQFYTLRQGCYDWESCSGTTTVTTLSGQPPNVLPSYIAFTGTVAQTVDVPILICPHELQIVNMIVTACDTVTGTGCNTSSHLSLNGSEIAADSIDPWEYSFEKLSEGFPACRLYTLHQGCKAGSCRGTTRVMSQLIMPTCDRYGQQCPAAFQPCANPHDFRPDHELSNSSNNYTCGDRASSSPFNYKSQCKDTSKFNVDLMKGGCCRKADYRCKEIMDHDLIDMIMHTMDSEDVLIRKNVIFIVPRSVSQSVAMSIVGLTVQLLDNKEVIDMAKRKEMIQLVMPMDRNHLFHEVHQNFEDKYSVASDDAEITSISSVVIHSDEDYPKQLYDSLKLLYFLYAQTYEWGFGFGGPSEIAEARLFATGKWFFPPADLGTAKEMNAEYFACGMMTKLDAWGDSMPQYWHVYHLHMDDKLHTLLTSLFYGLPSEKPDPNFLSEGDYDDDDVVTH